MKWNPAHWIRLEGAPQSEHVVFVWRAYEPPSDYSDGFAAISKLFEGLKSSVGRGTVAND